MKSSDCAHGTAWVAVRPPSQRDLPHRPEPAPRYPHRHRPRHGVPALGSADSRNTRAGQCTRPQPQLSSVSHQLLLLIANLLQHCFSMLVFLIHARQYPPAIVALQSTHLHVIHIRTNQY